jgi:very-short-patch-repair endonuclease
MDLVQFVRTRGGVARTAQLRQAGFSKADFSRALQDGRLNLLRRGVYAVDKPDRAILAAVQANAKLTCVSAGRFYGLWQLRGPATPDEPGMLHLSCGNGVPKTQVVDHAACMHPAHPCLPVAGLADVLLHALRCLPELEALVMVQSAVSQGSITVEFLKGKLPGNRNGAARSVLDLVIPRADSLTEVLARVHFLRAGLMVRMHADVPGVGEVDCLIEECLVVELDGGSHLEPRQVKKDQRRNNAALKAGLLPLRYYYDDVVHHPERMVAQVRSVLHLREAGRFGPGQPWPFLPDPD